MGGSRKKWEWGPRLKLDEARVVAPEEPPAQRAKKDRRRWCRGKVGVEHQWEIRISKWACAMRTRNSTSDHVHCGWRAKHARVNYSDAWRYEATGEWFWQCVHNHVCKSCGKILEHFAGVGKECPEVRPPVPAECKCWSCRVR